MHEHIPPEDLPGKVVALIAGLSMFGGFAHFFERLRHERLRRHWAIELAGGVFYSLAAGFTVWYIANANDWCPYAAAAAAIVAGHLGARLLFALQHLLLKRLQAIAGTDGDDDEHKGGA